MPETLRLFRPTFFLSSFKCKPHWERDVELDLVAPDPEDAKRLLVAEVKWRRLSAAERKQVLRQLEGKWSHCSLSARYPRVRFEVLDATMPRNE